MLILANIAGMFIAAGKWIVSNWRLLAFGVGMVAVLFIFGLVMRSCNTPKLDEAAIQKAQKAVAEDNRKEMIEVLAASDVAEKQIDANLASAENEKLKAFHEARKRAEALSNEQLAAELERRAKND